MSDAQGYFPPSELEKFTPEMQDAIVEIAELTGIIPLKRRCSMPEFARSKVCGWMHRPVTASISGSFSGISATQVKETYQKALRIWNEACNVGLTWTDDFDKANIYAKCRAEGGGGGGVLAWSFLPPCSANTTKTRLEQLYDIAEKWTVSWLLEVMLHELGHAIGLDHSTQKTALMYPYSSGGRILAPTKYELEIVIPLYGGPVTVPATPPDTVPILRGGMLLVNNLEPIAVNESGVLVYGGHNYKVEIKA